MDYQFWSKAGVPPVPVRMGHHVRCALSPTYAMDSAIRSQNPSLSGWDIMYGVRVPNVTHAPHPIQ